MSNTLSHDHSGVAPTEAPGSGVISASELLAQQLTEPRMLIDNLLAIPGAFLLVGSHKSGKTALAVQVAIAVAGGCGILFDRPEFPILEFGPVLIVERDDPAGAQTLQKYLTCSPSLVKYLPIFIDTTTREEFGSHFLKWLEAEIKRLTLKLVVLDSYTALRPTRRAGTDIVKVEQEELGALDALAKANDCTLLVIHHPSHGNGASDWSDTAAGTYAMGAASEGQIHVARFRDLPASAPERLVRFRGRHFAGYEMVLRFRRSTLDYEAALLGPPAPLFVEILELKQQLGNTMTFEPKVLYQDVGIPRATAHRMLSRLVMAGVVKKDGFGKYAFVRKVWDSVWTGCEVANGG